MMKIARAALLLIVAVPAVAIAGEERVGTTSANFLSVGTGAGILGMGGAVLGAGTDLNAASWNAAALGWVNATEFGLSHSGLVDEQSQEWAAAAGRWGQSGTRWALTGLYQGQGGLEGRDVLGNPTGNFDVSHMAFGAMVAQRLDDRFTVGLGVKYVREDLGTASGQGVTFDGGIQMRSGRFGIGVAGQNIGGRMDYDGAYYPFPANLGAGVSVDLPEYGLRIALDANVPRYYYSDLRGGVEWRWRDQFALRTGYRAELGADKGEALSGPAFGMGAGMGGFWFDYGFMIAGPARDGEHKFGITIRPGEFASGAFGAAAEPANTPVLPDRTSVTASEAKAKKPQRVEKQEKAKESVAGSPATPDGGKDQGPKKGETKSQDEADAGKPADEIPAKPETSKASGDGSIEQAPAKRPTTHKVKAGDTLYSIAKKYETTVPKIMYLNDMVNTTIHVGQVIKIPPLEKKR